MLKMKPALKKTLMAVACLSAVPAAQAAISLDRTRAIFNGGEKSMTLNVANDNKQLPYLAQAWIENEKQEKITTGPIVVTPPVQRLEPGAKSMVRLASTPDNVVSIVLKGNEDAGNGVWVNVGNSGSRSLLSVRGGAGSGKQTSLSVRANTPQSITLKSELSAKGYGSQSGSALAVISYN